MAGILDTYLKKYTDLEGWFSRENAIVWDHLLSFQARSGVVGNVMEIGVHGGRSAALLAMHTLPSESAVFADLDMREAARNAVMSEHPTNTIIFEGRSASIKGPADLENVTPDFRFIHIDGGHSGTELTQDLRLADALLGERGIICIDDFFSPQYPQLTDAVFRYVAANSYSLSLILVGLYKGYLVRPIAARGFLEEIEANLFATLTNRKCDGLSLCKTTYPDEINCFGLHWSQMGAASRVGPDWNQDDIVY